MKHFYKITTVAMVAALLFSLTSCLNISGSDIADLITSETTTTESVTETTSDTTTTEAEPSDTTTVPEITTETSTIIETSETTEENGKTEDPGVTTETSDTSDDPESAETSTAPSSDDTSSSQNKCSFSSDNLVKASKKLGAKVYTDADKFVDNFKKLQAKDKKAVKNYIKGATIKVSGSDIEKITAGIGNQPAQDKDFMSHMTDMGMLMAGDLNNGTYTIVVISYEVDDPQVIDDWFGSAATGFEDQLPDQYKNNDQFTLKTKLDKDGDVKTFLTSYTLNKDVAKKNNIPAHTGAYFGSYAQGNHGLFITLIDYDTDKPGIKMLDKLCKALKIASPSSFEE